MESEIIIDSEENKQSIVDDFNLGGTDPFSELASHMSF